MNEKEAIEGLMQEFNKGEQNEPGQENEAQKGEQQTTPQEVPNNTPQTQNDLPDIKKMLESQNQTIEELKSKLNEKTPEELTPEQTTEQEAIKQAQEKLGITQLQEKMQQEAQEREQVQEQKDKFQQEVSTFTKNNPDIKLDDLAKWAQDNGFDKVLGLGAKGWELVAQAMKVQATSKETPDNITPSSSTGAGVDAFNKLQKGEKVSDIELGMSILKASN